MTQPDEKIAIVGAGSWGTALALLLQSNGYPSVVWGHNAEAVTEITRTRQNARYLPGIPLPDEISFTSHLADLSGASLILMVTPSKAMRQAAGRLAALGLPESTVFLSCTKGVERGSGLRMSEIIAEVFPRNPIAVLSGPGHAEEVSRKAPTAVVLGCADLEIAANLQKKFCGRWFRAYTSEDIAGMELGGALKNIFAIAAGVSDGLGLGDNPKAALITRALAEMIRLGTALGGRPETFQGLSGIGDLMVTCYSGFSRNRQVGERLGRGETLAEISDSMQMIAEGAPTTYSAWECARKLDVVTPIIDQIRELLDGRISAREALQNLISRNPRSE